MCMFKEQECKTKHWPSESVGSLVYDLLVMLKARSFKTVEMLFFFHSDILDREIDQCIIAGIITIMCTVSQLKVFIQLKYVIFPLKKRIKYM